MLDDGNAKLVKKLIGKFMNTSKAAEELGLTTNRVRQLIKEGKLPALLIAGYYLIDTADLKLVRERDKPGPKKKIINLREPD
jgi:hypothetical protein